MKECDGCGFSFKPSELNKQEATPELRLSECRLCDLCASTPLGTDVLNGKARDKALVTINYGINYLASLLKVKE